eukprot:765403-Rhodomonas_salina.1
MHFSWCRRVVCLCSFVFCACLGGSGVLVVCTRAQKRKEKEKKEKERKSRKKTSRHKRAEPDVGRGGVVGGRERGAVNHDHVPQRQSLAGDPDPRQDPAPLAPQSLIPQR